MENPVTKIRKEMDLTKTEFAGLYDISMASLRSAEQGYFRTIPPKIIRILKDLGKTKEELQNLQFEYNRWRKENTMKRITERRLEIEYDKKMKEIEEEYKDRKLELTRK